MRLAIFGALVLAACASGKSGSDVDASSGSADAYVAPDSACGALPCDAVYVARSGADNAPGTEGSPMKTISAAVTKAATFTPPYAVFVKSGLYPEPVIMKAGVSVYGGFDDTWMRSDAVTTEITAPSPAVTFDAIQVSTILDGVTVKSDDATAPGTSSFAVLITGSTMIELRDVDVLPGIGATGLDGNDGGTGATAGGGGGGTPGCEDSGGLCAGCSRPLGGGGGTSSCGRTGGAGGNAGHGDNGGSMGASGVGGTAGGPGGGQGGVGTPGNDGAPGGLGSAGAGGIDAGLFVGSTFMASNGLWGAPGTPGNGGGGGGGGGGGNDSCDSYGSSGGGGGAGGCGGGAGTAGSGGGGSFGVVAVDSNVVVKSSTVTSSRGGGGGRGGRGGGGGNGGPGGGGGPYGGGGEQDDGGNGAAGGRGGNGGGGGHGGGGGGGPSAAVVCVGSATIAIPQTTLTGGTGGTGGPSMGMAGADGVTTRAIGCSFF